ncbi:MAG: hypothetical protein AAF702_06050 [Chloroflexota bacterium]
MNKKQKKLEGKLGSWADQASLSRTQAQPSGEQSEAVVKAKDEKPAIEKTASTSTKETRAAYPIALSLMDRIADTAKSNDMTTNQVVGQLLTWALDQVDAGHYKMS